MKIPKPRLLLSIITSLSLVVGAIGFSPVANAFEGGSWTDCTGFKGHTSICLDPTTGFGPIVYVLNANGGLVYATAAQSICTKAHAPIVHPKIYDQSSDVQYGGTTTGTIVLIVGYPADCRNFDTTGVASLTQTALDYVRWYSNGINTQYAEAVL